MSGYRAILFDACSTLLEVDTLRLEQCLAKSGRPAFGMRDAVWAVTTGTAHDATAGTHGDGPSWLPALANLVDIPLEALAQTWMREDTSKNLWGRAIEGAPSLLASLQQQGYRLGVVSNADGRIEDALRLAGLLDYLDVVIDSAVVGVAKPDPRIFDPALQALGLLPKEVCYVGDSVIFDVPAAVDAGVAVWLIDHTGQSEPDHGKVVTTFPELLHKLALL